MRASASPDPDLASIDGYFEKEMREVHIPGLALGIVHNEEVVHLRWFGEVTPGGRGRYAADALHPRVMATGQSPLGLMRRQHTEARYF